MSRDDAQEIADRLNDDIEGVISKYWPDWIRVREKGIDVALLTPRQKVKGRKPTSSFRVELNGSHRGRWYRFSQGIGGYGLALMHYAETGRVPDSKSDYREAFRYARNYLGLPTSDRQAEPRDDSAREERLAKERADREARARRDAEEKERRDAKRALSALEVWKETRPITGTQAEAYLVGRGIPPISEWPWKPDGVLGFHPALEFELDRDAGEFPALVARVDDMFGDLIAVWQIYLDRKSPVKADLEPSPKVGRGPAKGGAVRLGGKAAHIGGAEGIESALGAWALEDFRRPVWAFLSTSGMAAFEAPTFVERITIWPDSDKGVFTAAGKVLDPPGIRAARELQARMKAARIQCVINETGGVGDALDLLIAKRKFEEKHGRANGQ